MACVFGERKVNRSLVIKIKTQKSFVNDSSITYSKYFTQIFNEAVLKI